MVATIQTSTSETPMRVEHGLPQVEHPGGVAISRPAAGLILRPSPPAVPEVEHTRATSLSGNSFRNQQTVQGFIKCLARHLRRIIATLVSNVAIPDGVIGRGAYKGH